MQTIALIDDNEDNRLITRVMLQRHFMLNEYASGPEGLVGLLAHRPDLVLLDISMPEMDGYEVLERIRGDARLAGLPVVAYTANLEVGGSDRWVARGFDDYVPKPLPETDVFIRMLSRVLRRHQTEVAA